MNITSTMSSTRVSRAFQQDIGNVSVGDHSFVHVGVTSSDSSRGM